MSDENKTSGQKALEYLKDHPNATAKEIMDKGVSKSYAYRLMKDAEKQKNKPPEATQIRNLETMTKENPEEKKLEEIITETKTEEKTEESPQQGLLQTGFFEPSELKEIFKEANTFLDTEAKLPDTSCTLLGKLWAKPLNRWIGKSGDQNLDIKMAVIVTIGLLAPRIVKTVQKRGFGLGKSQTKTNPEGQ